MPFKQWGDRERITAADANRFWIQQDWVRKTADESVTSSVTLQDDNHLSLSVAAQTEYWLETFIMYDGNSAGDFKINWSYPFLSVVQWTHGGLRAASTATVGEISRTFLASPDGIDPSPDGVIGCVTGSTLVVAGEGRVQVAATPGTLTLRWAQATSNGTPTRVLAGSVIILTKLTT